MTDTVLQFIHRIKDQIGRQDKILEVGSLNVNGSVRPIFSDATEYVGIDIQAGNGVDHVMRGSQVCKEFPEEYFDCVIATEVFEHDIEFWNTLASIRKVLKPGGWFIATSPSIGFPYHPYPKDYWRFTEDSFQEVVFDGYTNVATETVADTVMGVGQKA